MGEEVPEKYRRSHQFSERAQRVIPAGTQTFSKAPTSFAGNATPLYLERGSGSHVFDVDGNEYIDYMLGLGPVTLGYDNQRVIAAAEERLQNGPTLSLPHPVEVELSERLVDIIPAAEMVRFGKNGSDVTSAAVRLARAYTGREKVAFSGYHGWQDWYVAATTRDRGVPDCVKELSIKFPFDDLDALQTVFEEHGDEVAAVLMEPMGTDLPDPDYLAAARDIVHENGALLVFDEMITGFRVALGGAQEHFDVVPDLACFGKGMANGFPLSALVGRADVMELLADIFFSFTFGGETMSLAASLETIEVLEDEDGIGHMWSLGQTLEAGVNDLVAEHGLVDRVSCSGLPPWTGIDFEAESDEEQLAMKSLFQQEVAERGILFNGNQFLCLAHSPADIDATLRAYDEALGVLSSAIEDGDVRERLSGSMIQPVFSRRNAGRGEDI